MNDEKQNQGMDHHQFLGQNLQNAVGFPIALILDIALGIYPIFSLFSSTEWLGFTSVHSSATLRIAIHPPPSFFLMIPSLILPV